jgi:hypothetical protein
MISSTIDIPPCHWCKKEQKESYAKVVQLFQTIHVCSSRCLHEYTKRAKTQILGIHLKEKQIRAYDREKDAAR